MDLAARKRELRRRISLRRRAADPATVSSAAASLAEIIAATAEFRNAPALALYAALPEELPTGDLFARAVAAGKPCFFPRCMPGTLLDFVAIGEWETLEPGRYGVREPPSRLSGGALPAGSLVIVPGVAFDREGNRLGQGKGYYDRAFSKDGARGMTLFGVGFAFQLVESVPVGKFDRRMDAVVTEQGILRPSSVSPEPISGGRARRGESKGEE